MFNDEPVDPSLARVVLYPDFDSAVEAEIIEPLGEGCEDVFDIDALADNFIIFYEYDGYDQYDGFGRRADISLRDMAMRYRF